VSSSVVGCLVGLLVEVGSLAVVEPAEVQFSLQRSSWQVQNLSVEAVLPNFSHLFCSSSASSPQSLMNTFSIPTITS